jgi:hypothetical protein
MTSLAIFGALIVSCLVFFVDLNRRLARRASLPGWVVAVQWAWGGGALALLGAPSALLAALFPVLMPLGIASAVVVLSRPGVREAVLGLGDSDLRALFLWRAVLGGMLLAMGAQGLLPWSFALSAGLGDIAVGWLAVVLPGRMEVSRNGALPLLFVNLAGLLDLAHVIVLAQLTAIPFILSGAGTPPTVLPFFAVPWMIGMHVVLCYGAVVVLRTKAAPA